MIVTQKDINEALKNIGDSELMELSLLNNTPEEEIIKDYILYCFLIEQELSRASWLEYYEENISFGGIN